MSPHFAAIPGDEQLEQPRMSIKRLARRQAAGETGVVDQSGESLPNRTWEGMQASKLQLPAEWHVDCVKMEASDAEAEGSPAGTPVLKQKRNILPNN